MHAEDDALRLGRAGAKRGHCKDCRDCHGAFERRQSVSGAAAVCCAHMNLRKLARGTPGRRFTDRYSTRRGHGAVAKALAIAVGSGLVVLGAIMLVTPGPGALVLLLGAALVAGESQRCARGLDRLELALRARFCRARR
jgi:hypothetical protein